MTPEEIAQTKDQYRKEADKAYAYYVSTATQLAPEDL